MQPADRREEYGHFLDPPAEVRAQAAPLRHNPLIRKHLGPAVNAVEHQSHGNVCKDTETIPPA